MSNPMSENSATNSDFLTDLRAAVPQLSSLTTSDTMMAHLCDHASFAVVGAPLAVVFPTTTEEVSAICRCATAHRVPIVARGEGTGLSGGANAIDGSVVVSLTRMNRVLEIDENDAVAVVQPGVINAELSQLVYAAGLFYPPDPSSQDISSIGGNAATNAGGMCCVKYGVTRDYVIGIEVVLADGRITRLGRRSRKGVAGLDLTALFVGSEGTLGIITEITVRLIRHPGANRATVVAEFHSLEAAGRTVHDIMRTQTPALLEIMDAQSIEAVRLWKNVDFTDGIAAVLIAQSDVSDSQARADEINKIEAMAVKHGALSTFSTEDTREGEDLVAIRRMAGPATEQLGTVLVDDVAVPLSNLVAFLTGSQTIAKQLGAHLAIVGHAGDGNMHPSVIFDAADADRSAVALQAFEAIGRLGLDLGGTITGEHGVGLLKAGLLELELSPVALDMHRSIKAALDPLNLMNPGKVFRS